jgi:hypothetical protein
MTAKWPAASLHDTSAHMSVRIATHLAAHEQAAAGANRASDACRLRTSRTSPSVRPVPMHHDRTHSDRTRTPSSDRSPADHPGRSEHHRERQDRRHPFHVKHLPRAPPRPTATGYRDPPLTGEPPLTPCVVTTLLHVDDRAEPEGPTHVRDPAISRPCRSARSRGNPTARSDALDQPFPRLRSSHPRRRDNKLPGMHWSRSDEVRGEASLERN